MAREPFNRIWTETPTVDDFDEPTNTMWDEGWRGGADQDPPEAYAQNWWQNRVDFALQGIERNGAMDWNSNAQYGENALALSPGNELYASQSTGNVGNDPDVDGGSNWIRIALGRATNSVFGLFKKATQAEVDSGSTDDSAVTPEKLRFGVSVQASSNGYIALPTWLGGIVIQWGTASVEGGIRVSTNFPMAFPNQCFQAVACDNGDGTPSTMGVDFTASSIIVETNETSGICRYIAIGH